MNTLGERLRISRDRKGFTQVQVKERTNINNKTLSGYEKDVSEPDTKTLSTLANLYEVSYKWLLTGKGSIEENKHSHSEEEIDDEIRKLMKEVNVWYKNEPENKELKLRMLRKMLKSFEEE